MLDEMERDNGFLGPEYLLKENISAAPCVFTFIRPSTIYAFTNGVKIFH